MGGWWFWQDRIPGVAGVAVKKAPRRRRGASASSYRGGLLAIRFSFVLLLRGSVSIRLGLSLGSDFLRQAQIR